MFNVLRSMGSFLLLLVVGCLLCHVVDAQRYRLSSAVLERFETAVLDMDEPGIAAACPLLAPLGLATRGQELYLGFARRALEAELEAGAGDGSSPATQRLPAIYNTSAAFLRRYARTGPFSSPGLCFVCPHGLFLCVVLFCRVAMVLRQMTRRGWCPHRSLLDCLGDGGPFPPVFDPWLARRALVVSASFARC